MRLSRSTGNLPDARQQTQCAARSRSEKVTSRRETVVKTGRLLLISPVQTVVANKMEQLGSKPCPLPSALTYVETLGPDLTPAERQELARLQAAIARRLEA